MQDQLIIKCPFGMNLVNHTHYCGEKITVLHKST